MPATAYRQPYAKRWATKDPADTLDYTYDWQNVLVPGETISDVLWTVPSGLTKGAETLNGGAATVWLSGGANCQDYCIVCKITTSAGRIVERTVGLRVENL